MLSRDFAASGFDLRRLLRAIVLSNAYQLSSRTDVDDPSRALHFAQMNVKSFTAEQLYDCIAVATQRAALAGGPTSEGGLLRFADMDRQTFLQQFRAPPGRRPITTRHPAGADVDARRLDSQRDRFGDERHLKVALCAVLHR
jgi:hypothetical protein